MNFQQDDILDKNETVWISQRLIVEVCEIKSETLRSPIRRNYKSSVQPCYRHHNILPDTGKGWRFAKIKNKFYYALDNIPNRKPTYYRDLFGDREELVNAYNEAMTNKTVSLLEPHFLHFKREIKKVYYQAYLNCSKIQQENLCIAAALLEGAIVWINENEIDTSKSAFFKEYCNLLIKYDIQYLPKNHRKLKEKIIKVTTHEYPIVDVVYLPRQWNNNALVHVCNEVKGWAIQLRSMGENYSNDSIIRKVSHLCKMTGKPIPSRRWFGQNIFEKHSTKFITSPSRFGTGERGAYMYEGYIPMKNAIFAGDCWHVDATRMQLIAHKTEAGNLKHLFIIAVRDVHSGDVLGYNFDYKEDRWSVISALKMAVTESGYLPYQIVFDRFPGHNTEEAKRLFAQLEQMGVKVTISHNPQSKAKLERWFGTMQSVFADSSEYYYGEGIKSNRLFAHRSPEYLKKVRHDALKEGFNLHDSWRESMLIVEAYRDTPFSYYSRKYKSVNKCPKILHSESEKPHVKFLEEHQISMIFGLKKKMKVGNLGLITTEIQSATYQYQIEDYEIISKEPEVILSYDLNDLSKVFVFKKKHHFLIYLCEAKEFEAIQPYGPQAEFNRIAIEKARIKDINNKRKEELSDKTSAFDEVAHLMGKFSNKDEVDTSESAYLNEDFNDDKQVVGSDISFDEDIDFEDNVRNDY